MHRTLATLFGTMAVLAAAASPALAVYPERSIRFVVPWPAGGSSDSAARVVAQQLTERLGQPVVVDNKPGASGNLGTSEVARAKPDGYTLLLSSGPFSINPSLYRNLPFDTLRDFAPVTQIAATPSVLVVHPSFPAQTLQEFIAAAKDKSKSLDFASPGNGTAQHLSMELLKKKADLSLTHIAYRGGAPALNDLLGGHVKVMLSGIPEVMPHIQAGTLRPLAISTAKRSEQLPNVPTLMEAGLADGELAGWNGLHVPAGTPAEIIDRLGNETREALKKPDVLQRLKALGFEIRGTSTREFGAFVTSQIERFREAVEISGAKVD
jgi:tripartite-type tricarboxylate transporter receptor subunit TctC